MLSDKQQFPFSVDFYCLLQDSAGLVAAGTANAWLILTLFYVTDKNCALLDVGIGWKEEVMGVFISVLIS